MRRKELAASDSGPGGPDLEAVERVLPERQGWEGFVKRLVLCCGDLELAAGGRVAAHCVAAGCEAVAALEKSRLWERLLPDGRRERRGFEDRVRLGLFFAGCLRTLLPLLCRVEVTAAGKVWEPFEASLPDFLGCADGDGMAVRWRDGEAHAGRVLTLASLFLGRREIVDLLTPVVAQEVFDCLRPGGNAGLFGTMLGDAGAVAEAEAAVDAAALFLEGLRRSVGSGKVRVNRTAAEVFVGPVVCFLVAPHGVDLVLGYMKRKLGHDLNGNRIVVYEDLAAKGWLVDVEPGGLSTCRARLNGKGWRGTVEARGLPIATAAVWPGERPAWIAEGGVTVIRTGEESDGRRCSQAGG